ncbi:MAG TPA: glycoside hydrolase family 2 TIM barrel-domain containing protein [Bacteroidales bacterium]|nr:glycoside hydrolase family 2 TIM barrel-domain containing protein [Bacteroidales bacterium]
MILPKGIKDLTFNQGKPAANPHNFYTQVKLGIFAFLSIILMITCNNMNQKKNQDGTAKVKLIQENDGFRLYVNNKPWFIKGAGTHTRNPSEVAKYGGNTIRTWSTGNESITGQQILDTAHSYGLMVVLGLDIARERHGFDYNDKKAVEAQFEKIKAEVIKYKDHPALLAWGIGNELNLHYTNLRVWDAVNDISLMIKELDPNHPTTTMLAGARTEDIQAIVQQASSLDFISFQLYGSLEKLPEFLAKSKYQGAYAITEWGVTGHWEVPKTSWGRPIEENSHVKAMTIQKRYETIIAADTRQCIGSFVFLWGHKQERTPTWYGLFLETGEKTESVDVMQYLWTGNWPENRSPQVHELTINNLTAYDNIIVEVAQEVEAEVTVSDPNGDALTFQWMIMPEVPSEQQSDGGDFEPKPATIFNMQTNENKISVMTPQNPGEYRLFVYVADGKNNAATANIPFLVK